MFIDIVMKRIYLFNIVAWNYTKKIGFPVCKMENFSGLQAHRRRGQSARASPTPHHTLNEEQSARFLYPPCTKPSWLTAPAARCLMCVNRELKIPLFPQTANVRLKLRISQNRKYSYFEEGCREKCTRQSRKVLWAVLSPLFFKEIWNNGTRGHRRMFANAKGKQQ